MIAHFEAAVKPQILGRRVDRLSYSLLDYILIKRRLLHFSTIFVVHFERCCDV